MPTPKFNWKEYSVSITLPYSTPAQKLAHLYLTRDLRESKELMGKQLMSIFSTTPLYHHGDKV